ncbi:MAG: hypothetical protein JW744_00325 [Candidatus Diapherotrites archaeon]|uniref:Uncharacterized protein n=1 Tax=Candidatus Iainarchaeum sp. TaxID=3101447 RepID=A0A938YWC9_9ARCH|nr:hypothetical protein [Candidatus Diapherotrites archaeon]
MYPDEGGADVGPAPAGPRAAITRNLEGLIPLILIIIIAAFLGHRFGFWQIPFLPDQGPIQMLVIGEPSIDMMGDLDGQRDLVYYQVKHPADLEFSAREQIAQYDIILLDQHMYAPEDKYNKSVSRTLGEAIENYVTTGGKLIVVMDSGIYQSGGIYGTGVATDIVGWSATFKSIIPVECSLASNRIPTCVQPIYLSGKVHRVDYSHKIMEGIEVAPADPAYGPLAITTFDVRPTGHLIASIKNIATSSYYPGIVEQRLIFGKVIYFNYDPSMTPGIWHNTLEYLR